MISGYLSDIKKAIEIAQQNNFSSGLVKGIEGIYDDLQNLAPFLSGGQDYEKRLKADIEKPVNDLIASCQEKLEPLTLGNMRQLRDRVRLLKALWSKAR